MSAIDRAVMRWERSDPDGDLRCHVCGFPMDPEQEEPECASCAWDADGPDRFND